MPSSRLRVSTGLMSSSWPKLAADRYDASTSSWRNRAASSTSDPRARLMAAAPMAPMVVPGKAKVADWPSKGIIPMTIEPKPYALRRVTVIFGTRACVWAAYIRAPLRRMPRSLRLAPRHDPGIVGEKDERQMEGVGHGDEVSGLVSAVGIE